MTRKTVILALLAVAGLATLGLTAAANGAIDRSTDAEVSIPAATPAPALTETASGSYFPPCENMHGSSCPVVGYRARCWWVQAQEPSICVCQTTNTWKCAGLG